MAIVASLCVAYVFYCLATNPAGPFTTAASIEYLHLSPKVPLGYPLFLKIFGPRGAIVAQPVFFGAALAFLGRELLRASRTTWVAAVAVALFLVVPQIREWHASILAESLFLSLAIVFGALSVRFVERPSWHWMVLVATTAGLSATVHRSGFALVPVMLLMVIAQRHRLQGSHPALFFVAALAPFFVIVGIEQAVASIVRAATS